MQAIQLLVPVAPPSHLSPHPADRHLFFSEALVISELSADGKAFKDREAENKEEEVIDDHVVLLTSLVFSSQLSLFTLDTCLSSRTKYGLVGCLKDLMKCLQLEATLRPPFAASAQQRIDFFLSQQGGIFSSSSPSSYEQQLRQLDGEAPNESNASCIHLDLFTSNATHSPPKTVGHTPSHLIETTV